MTVGNGGERWGTVGTEGNGGNGGNGGERRGTERTERTVGTVDTVGTVGTVGTENGGDRGEFAFCPPPLARASAILVGQVPPPDHPAIS